MNIRIGGPAGTSDGSSAASGKTESFHGPGPPNEQESDHDNDPLRAARQRGLAAREEIWRREGGAWSAATVADYLGCTEADVDASRRADTLIGLKSGRDGYVYPAWQFTHR